MGEGGGEMVVEVLEEVVDRAADWLGGGGVLSGR